MNPLRKTAFFGLLATLCLTSKVTLTSADDLENNEEALKEAESLLEEKFFKDFRAPEISSGDEDRMGAIPDDDLALNEEDGNPESSRRGRQYWPLPHYQTRAYPSPSSLPARAVPRPIPVQYKPFRVQSGKFYIPQTTALTPGGPISYAPTVYSGPNLAADEQTAGILEQIASTMATKSEITAELNKRIMKQEEEEQDEVNAESRVAETKVNFGSPEDEKRLVESVNDLIGVVGRQAFGSGPGSILADDDFILPGRPNPEPIETLSTTLTSELESYNRPQECCLFVFFDGSAYYFDDYLRMLTGHYRLMYGTVNGHPHYVARGCKEAELYGPNCSYIWHSNSYGWIIGIGTYIGQTKGVVYTRADSQCPTDNNASWRYLNKDLHWKDNGNIVLQCAS